MPRLPSAVWVIAAGKAVVHTAATAFGYHRDELYFVAASKRLATSYVDFQPVVPLLVRMQRAVFGDNLVALRAVPALAGAATIVLGALIARELGGDRRAQTAAAVTLLVVPLFVGMATLLNTVVLETPAWLLVVFVFARLLRTREPRWWLAVGAAIGLALLVKFTVLAYLAGLGTAIVATSLRRDLRTPWPWLGAVVAGAMIAPSLVWQAANGFPVAEFVSNQGGGGAVLGLRGRLGFVVSLVLLPGPFALLVWLPGLRRLLRDPLFRAIGIAQLAALAVFLLAAGKGYYAAPAIAVLLASGAVAVTGWAAGRRRVVAVALAVNMLPIPLLFPGVVPISVLRGDPDINQASELGERLGWEDVAEAAAGAVRTLEPGERSRAIVLGANYALSAAVEFHADRVGLRAVSGHNSAYLWWPEIPRDHVAIVLGFERDELERLYGDVRRVGTIRNRHGVQNYEWGKPVWVAREPKVTPDDLRERVKTFEA